MPRAASSLALRAAALAVSALLPAAPAPAAAQAAFDYGTIVVSARRYLYGNVVEEQTDLAPAGSPALASVFQEFGSRFPTSQSAVAGGYSTSVMTGTGFGGVGVSFWSFARPDHAALATWTQDVTNVGQDAGRLFADFDIPFLEVGIQSGHLYGPFPAGAHPGAFAGVRLDVTRFDSTGVELGAWNVFDYHLAMEHVYQGSPCTATHEFTISDDLRARFPSGWQVLDGRGVCQLTSPGFGGSVGLATLAPGERLALRYVMRAENFAWRTGTPELGYHALAGDPFSVSGAGGIVVRPATTVPEPATAMLLGTGLAGAALAGRRRRRGVTAAAPPSTRR